MYVIMLSVKLFNFRTDGLRSGVGRDTLQGRLMVY